MNRLLLSASIALALWVAAGTLFGCLGSDDGGGTTDASDLASDRVRDVGGQESSVDAVDREVPDDDDTGPSDDGTGDAATVDRLTCQLVDYGYGPIWDGIVESSSAGPEPAPMTGITEAHNAVRRFVGVPELSWSTALAGSAQVWADHLADTLDCNLQHDPDSSQGENLSAAASSGTLSISPQEVVGGWSCEREDWDNDAITCNGVSGFGVSPRSCGHYTQVVWDDTTEVGCGVAYCDLAGYSAVVWVCRYTPPGNWVGQRPYGG